MIRIRTKLISLLIIPCILLLGCRLYLPIWAKSYVNRTLGQIPGYRGEIEDIDIHLWRGAYSIHGLRLVKTSGRVPVPFFSSPLIDLSVQWRELFHGAFVGEIELVGPKLNFVNASTAQKSQTGINPKWQKAAKDLFPLRINHFRGTEGEIHFRDFERDPKVDVVVNDVTFHAENLTNSEKISKDLNATIEGKGLAESHAPLVVHVKLDPFKEEPTFSLDASLKGLDLKKLNDFFKSYAYVDVQNGTFELYTELSSNSGKFGGYMKPFFKDIEIFDLENDSNNPLQLVWEAIVGFVAELVENQSKDQIATKIPLSGRFKDPKTDTWEAIGSLLSNAFIEALRPGLDTKRSKR